MSLVPGAGSGPIGVAVSPDGELAFVACHDAEALSVVNLPARGEVSVAEDIGRAAGVVLSPDGDRVYVTMPEDDQLRVFAGGDDIELLETIAVGEGPWGVDVDLDGRIFVANEGGDSVSVIDPDSASVIETISDGIGDRPHAFGDFIENPNTSSEDDSVAIVDIPDGVPEDVPEDEDDPDGGGGSVNPLFLRAEVEFPFVRSAGRTRGLPMPCPVVSQPSREQYIPCDPELCWDIDTTADFSGDVRVTIDYDALWPACETAARGDETRLRLMHDEDRDVRGVPEDITIVRGIDTRTRRITGRASSFSPFWLMVERPPCEAPCYSQDFASLSTGEVVTNQLPGLFVSGTGSVVAFDTALADL